MSFCVADLPRFTFSDFQKGEQFTFLDFQKGEWWLMKRGAYHFFSTAVPAQLIYTIELTT